jgi:RecA-family ATPase
MAQPAFQHSDPAERFAHLPQQMRDARRWLLWKALPNADPVKKPRKVPYYVDGSPRQGQLDAPDDVARLATLAEATAQLPWGYTGIGFALGPDGAGGCWQGVDVDRPELADLATSLPGYVERSPSGQGFHAIGYGRAFASLGANGSGLEAYAAGRYFTVTGERMGAGELTCLAEAVETRLRPFHSPAAVGVAGTAPARPEAPGGFVDATAETVADLRSALAAISADDYAAWVNMGLALKGLGDAGLGLWLEWSGSSAKFHHGEALAKWATFEPSSTGFRAVFAEAQRRGWQNPARHPNAGLEVPAAIAGRSFTVAGVPFGATWQLGFKAQLTSTVARVAFEPATYAEFYGARPAPPAIVANHYFGDVGVIVAPGGTGKTTILLYQAIHIRLGLPLWGMPILKPGPVLILTAEDGRELLIARLRSICAELALTDDQTRAVAEGVLICDVSGAGFRLTEVDREVVRPAEAALAALVEASKALNPALLVIDPAVSFGVGESRVNDAEQGLVEAGRRIVREVGCCVLYVHHSGKANARERAVDQYAGRGGSAFADGARMVHVLQRVEPAEWLKETGDELQPGETALRLARPKGSYCPPQPDILIKRRGYRFEAVGKSDSGLDASRAAQADRLWQLLRAELAVGRFHSKNSVEALDCGLRRTELRAALARLEASGRVELRERPGVHQRGARQYLHPVAAANDGEDAFAGAPMPPENPSLNL